MVANVNFPLFIPTFYAAAFNIVTGRHLSSKICYNGVAPRAPMEYNKAYLYTHFSNPKFGQTIYYGIFHEQGTCPHRSGDHLCARGIDSGDDGKLDFSYATTDVEFIPGNTGVKPIQCDNWQSEEYFHEVLRRNMHLVAPGRSYMIPLAGGVKSPFDPSAPRAKRTLIAPPCGCICKRCKSLNEFAAPNQPDGKYLCYECR